MLPWMIAGLLVIAFFVVLVIRNAEADDKLRKQPRKSQYSDY